MVECIDPDLLLYICQYELAKKHRTNNPAKVSALTVHRWVMMKHKKGKLEMGDSEGIKRLKSLKLALNGHAGVRGVQNLFIQIDKTRKHFRLKTSEKPIIKWVVYIQYRTR